MQQCHLMVRYVSVLRSLVCARYSQLMFLLLYFLYFLFLFFNLFSFFLSSFSFFFFGGLHYNYTSMQENPLGAAAALLRGVSKTQQLTEVSEKSSQFFHFIPRKYLKVLFNLLPRNSHTPCTRSTGHAFQSGRNEIPQVIGCMQTGHQCNTWCLLVPTAAGVHVPAPSFRAWMEKLGCALGDIGGRCSQRAFWECRRQGSQPGRITGPFFVDLLVRFQSPFLCPSLCPSLCPLLDTILYFWHSCCRFKRLGSLPGRRHELNEFNLMLADVANQHARCGESCIAGTHGRCEDVREKKKRTNAYWYQHGRTQSGWTAVTVKTFIDSVAIHGWPACE